MFQPLVSIIIPSFNSEKYLSESLDSVANQTYINWECIVVDDGSTDETINIVESYCKRDTRYKTYLRPQQKFKGPSSCRNFGIEKARGEFLVFLDSDDLLAGYCLEDRLKAFEKHTECDFLVFQMERFIDVPNEYSSALLDNLNTDHCLSSFLQLNSIWQVTSPIYKTNFLCKKLGFNEKLLNYEDLELAARVIVNSSNFKLFSNTDCFYRNDENYSAKYKSERIISKSIKSFIVVLKSLNDEIISKCEKEDLRFSYCQDIVIGYKRLFIAYIKENVKQYNKQNKIIISFFKINKYLTFKQYIVFLFVHNFLFKFYNVKGFGLFRFIKLLYK